jgi:glycosyltransferase involved in cell wall biosynthesis
VSPSISIVIPSVRGDQSISLVKALRVVLGPDSEIIVVDDTPTGSVSETFAAELGREGQSIVKILRGLSAGPASARNMGADFATGKWVLFVDDDVVFSPRAMQRAVEFSERASHMEALEFAIVSDGSATNGSWRWRRVQRLTKGGFLSAFIMVERGAFLSIGGFEESWPFPHREDTDLALRLSDVGVKWSFVEEPLVTHPDELVGFHKFLRVAKFSAVESKFIERHGMPETVRSFRFGSLRIRGLRVWFPAISLLTAVGMVLLRKPRSAFSVVYLSGAVLSASHSQYLGYSTSSGYARAVGPSGALPWSVFSALSGYSFLKGSLGTVRSWNWQQLRGSLKRETDSNLRV